MQTSADQNRLYARAGQTGCVAKRGIFHCTILVFMYNGYGRTGQSVCRSGIVRERAQLFCVGRIPYLEEAAFLLY